MEKINFEDGKLIKTGYVEIDGTQYTITEAEYEGNTPLSAYVLNKMQDNIEIDINTNISNLTEHKYHLDITENITAMTNITLPFYYKVGENCLDVYYTGERLIRNTINVEGHYNEIGEEGNISNQIQVGWDITEGRYFDFVVRGEYNVES